MSNEDGVREARFMPAVGELPHRSSSTITGAQDLTGLIDAAEAWGIARDREDDGPVGKVESVAALFGEIEEYGPLGRRRRERILSAHDVPQAVLLRVCELWDDGWLPDLAGLHIHTRTEFTTQEKGTPGVVRHPDGTKTVTYVFVSLSGGTPEAPYSLPVCADPARCPTDATSLALQGVAMAREARTVFRREIRGAGSLPLIGGTVCPAEIAVDDGRIVGDPVAIGDVAEAVRILERARVPMLLHAMLGPGGDLRAPPDVYLDLTPTAGPEGERPGTCAGVGVLIREAVAERLLVAHRTIAQQMFVPVPSRVAGTDARCSTGGVIYDLEDATQVVVCGATYVSPDGVPGIAVTNIDRSPVGMRRLALALDALFSVDRGDCRDRVGDLFMSTFSISATTPAGARTLAAIGLLTVIPTVLRRIPVGI